ncbi:hypothetical protein SDRG_07730 [Saprolegnia diclina VS20]|uniref:Protein SYS1 n=1 Tax=Saprolegnia diclina (strain VS20) TaxID=1156394 RepID=T0RX09_SAPDV|nr:hypothetical protein SDRG_07730 [Saprolegnia diclina VS20]EQC34932.1 hypothetical protein SDRG_07730 [Saprolegnia diclina VS20]|eukprot:XP_008611804.1 hypothetical protein SDRG_07730 [Saprolegnia diclina VS20]
MPRFYGRGQWDPKLIGLQIVCMQCAHYIGLGVLLGLCHGAHLSLDQFFSYDLHALESIDGVKTSFAHITSGLVNAVLLCYFVERAKKCLDFGVTLHVLDLLVCCVYKGFPSTWSWWIVHGVALAITVILGEYLCSRRELEEIPMLDLFTRRGAPSPRKKSTQME